MTLEIELEFLFKRYYYTRLGFINPKNPIEDFETLKSITTKNASTYLTLEFMNYFADKYKTFLQNIVSDEKTIKSPDYLFPFVRACLAIVKLIYTLLELNKPYNECNADEVDHLNLYKIIFVLFYRSINVLPVKVSSNYFPSSRLSKTKSESINN